MTSEFYIRHINGCTLSVVDERHLEECLEAAIDRRTGRDPHLKFLQKFSSLQTSSMLLLILQQYEFSSSLSLYCYSAAGYNQ